MWNIWISYVSRTFMYFEYGRMSEEEGRDRERQKGTLAHREREKEKATLNGKSTKTSIKQIHATHCYYECSI